MRINFLVPLAAIAALGAPVLCAPRPLDGKEHYSAGDPTLSSYSDSLLSNDNGLSVSPYVEAMLAAVVELGNALKSASKTSAASSPDFSKAEGGIHHLVWSLGNATDYLQKSDKQLMVDLYGEDHTLSDLLTELSDAVVPVAKLVTQYKPAFVAGGYVKVVASILVSLNKAFDHFYQALKVRVDADFRDKIAPQLQTIICALDDTIASLDATLALTDKQFCASAGKGHCSDWNTLPKPCPGFDDCGGSSRLFIQASYANDCFDPSCRTEGWCQKVTLSVGSWKPDSFKCHGGGGGGNGPPNKQLVSRPPNKNSGKEKIPTSSPPSYPKTPEKIPTSSPPSYPAPPSYPDHETSKKKMPKSHRPDTVPTYPVSKAPDSHHKSSSEENGSTYPEMGGDHKSKKTSPKEKEKETYPDAGGNHKSSSKEEETYSGSGGNQKSSSKEKETYSGSGGNQKSSSKEKETYPDAGGNHKSSSKEKETYSGSGGNQKSSSKEKETYSGSGGNQKSSSKEKEKETYPDAGGNQKSSSKEKGSTYPPAGGDHKEVSTYS